MSQTLTAIRRDAPEPDRREPALAPNPEPHWATARDGSTYVRISIYPRTLDELFQKGRDFGKAAVTDLQWGCVIVWLMNQPHETDLSNPNRVAMLATQLVRDHDRVRLGYPRHDGAAWNTPTLEGISPEARQEAELVAKETRAEWVKAGRQHLGETNIRREYQHLVACPAFIEKYIKEPE